MHKNDRDEKKLASGGHGHGGTSFKVSFLAASTSGAIEASLMYPFEFIKTQLQLQSKTNPKFSSPISVAKITIQENGIFGLYRGLSTLFIGSVAKATSRFTVYEFVKGNLSQLKDQVSFGQYIMYSMFGGAMGGACEAIVAVTPMETIKTKMIHDQNAPPDQRKYRGLVHGVSTIIKQEGFGGVYKGVAATILKQSTNQMARFGVFDTIRYLRTGDPAGQLAFWETLLAGACAGAVSVFVNNPIDVIKTKMQGLEAAQYKSVADCAKKILQQHGPSYFYRGVTPRLARVCGDAAITFTAYNELVPFYKKLVS